jgi:hypothetical protein
MLESQSQPHTGWNGREIKQKNHLYIFGSIAFLNARDELAGR